MASKKEPTTPLGRRLSEALTARGLSGNKLAEMVGSDSGNISRLVTGARGKSSVHPTLMWAIARALNVRAEWLWLGEGPMVATSAAAETSPSARDKAAAIAAELGVSAAAIDSVRARCRGRVYDGRSVRWWVAEMQNEDDQRERD